MIKNIIRPLDARVLKPQTADPTADTHGCHQRTFGRFQREEFRTENQRKPDPFRKGAVEGARETSTAARLFLRYDDGPLFCALARDLLRFFIRRCGAGEIDHVTAKGLRVQRAVDFQRCQKIWRIDQSIALARAGLENITAFF